MGSSLHYVIRQRKRAITLCNALADIIPHMQEEWETLATQWMRVKWARVYWQTKSGAGSTAKDAAESLGMPESTYLQYERPPGTSRTAELRLDIAQRIGRKFKVDWAWLMTGRGSPFYSEERERIYLRVSKAPLEEVDKISRILDAALGENVNRRSA